MKRILLDSDKHFYKANLHCHSTQSDGKMSVEALKVHYKQNGYAIIAFSDHEHLIDNSHLNDDGFLAITACELAIKEFPKLSTLKKQDMKVCHLNLFAKDPKNVDTPCYSSVCDHFITDTIRGMTFSSGADYQRVYSHEGVSEIIRIANERGFLVSYNHPRWSLENATDYLGYHGLWAVEIYNHSCNLQGLYEYDINTYDDFLRDGQALACVAGDDNHDLESTCGGFTMINAGALDYARVIDAMERHQLYTSTGPEIHHLELENGVATLTFAKGTAAMMSTRGRRTERKTVDDPDGPNTVQFQIQPDDGYIRFDVIDGCGRRANTCAYFV